MKTISRFFLVFVFASLSEIWAQDDVANSYPPMVRENVTDVAVDAAGNQYLTGSFSGSLDFNPGVGEDTRQSAGFGDAFVTRFNADGSYAWTQTFGGTSYDSGFRIAVGNGRVYVTGDFHSTDAGIGGAGSVSTTGDSDAYVICLDAATGQADTNFGTGGIQKFGGSETEIGTDIVVGDNGRVYMTGWFRSNNAGIGVAGSLATVGGSDGCVVCLDATSGLGDANFGTGGVQKFGGGGDDWGYSIALGNGRVYVTGAIQSTDLGIGGLGSFSTTGGRDALVVCLDAATGLADMNFGTGGLQKFGGTSADDGNSIAFGNGRVYVTGYFDSANAGIGGTGTLAPVGGYDTVVFCLDADGVAPDGQADTNFGTGGMQKFGGNNYDEGLGIAADGNGHVFACGTFSSDNAGIGGSGSVAPTGLVGNWPPDAYIICLNATTGQAVSGFAANGIQKFGGSNEENGNSIAVGASGGLFLAGPVFGGTDIGVGGPGSFSTAGGFYSFLVQLDPATGAMNQSPQILSVPTANPNPIVLQP